MLRERRPLTDVLSWDVIGRLVIIVGSRDQDGSKDGTSCIHTEHVIGTCNADNNCLFCS